MLARLPGAVSHRRPGKRAPSDENNLTPQNKRRSDGFLSIFLSCGVKLSATFIPLGKKPQRKLLKGAGGFCRRSAHGWTGKERRSFQNAADVFQASQCAGCRLGCKVLFLRGEPVPNVYDLRSLIVVLAARACSVGAHLAQELRRSTLSLQKHQDQ